MAPLLYLPKYLHFARLLIIFTLAKNISNGAERIGSKFIATND
jgi:hypothetical protein